MVLNPSPTQPWETKHAHIIWAVLYTGTLVSTYISSTVVLTAMSRGNGLNPSHTQTWETRQSHIICPVYTG